MNDLSTPNKGEIVIYTAADGTIQTEVRMHEESLWLSLNQIAELFERDKSVISRHIKKVYNEAELEKSATVAKYATVQIEGGRKIERTIEFYNLDMILSVGNRVNSKRGTQFRIWANRILKEHLIQGYTLNQKRLQEPAALFLYFLEKNNLLTRPDGQRAISNDGLAALTLLIAISKPEEKDTMVKIVITILNRTES